MKELSNIQSDKLNVREERPVRKEEKFLGSIKIERGQKVFQLEVSTRIISAVVYDQVAYKINKGVRHKLITKPGFMYCSALNLTNAERKFKKMIIKAIRQ